MAGHNANAYPEDHLYVKSPAETEAVVLAEIEEARIKYDNGTYKTEIAYRHRAGVPDPNPPIEPDPEPEAIVAPPPGDTSGQQAPPAPAPAPPPAPRSTKKPSSTKK
jgi:hypothetical protein